MQMNRHGREYWLLTIDVEVDGEHAEIPATSWAASFDDGATWKEATDIDGRSGWLVAGPEAKDNPAGTIVLEVGAYRPLGKHVDNPEIVVPSLPELRIT